MAAGTPYSSIGRICFCLCLFAITVICHEQISPGSRYYSRDGVYVPLNGPDHRTETYVYKDRRYGYRPSYLDVVYKEHAKAPENRYLYEDTTSRFPLPGVLSGWREDLQGRERPDSKNLHRDVTVSTNYGQVQGFKVYLYDSPQARHRPWNLPVERVTKHVNVFLGIPYAMPPTKEGRFKPPRPHKGWQLLQAVDWGPVLISFCFLIFYYK